ncbi:FkbM family methyltransferase [Pseudomonas sp. CDFA 602]|uniref:FkbM family methyltransferase n=1 Tax=Pseudomonas californiensis TaxID=2829823 RepID=UPI001E532D58|nr:FkbM family methyltransferase [Pseudomonas californiensis]MCD5996850.1 FkbM family methyltransferase [Pseudomonas californiensis]MCD5998325.1 FkbM family methyltransferase [Pseudomonas californiensis]
MQSFLSLPSISGVSGDSQQLQAQLESAVGQYQLNPCFCIPALAQARYASHGETCPIVLLGTGDFSHAFINEVGHRANIIAVVDDFKAKDNNDFRGYPIITSDAFVSLARSTELVSVNACRYDYSRRYFKNLTQRHTIPMLNFEQSMRWLAASPTKDHRIDDWGSYIAGNLSRFIKLADRLDDDYSRITLFSVLLSHLTCNPEWILNIAKPYPTLYFRSGLWVPDQHEVFVDCGASIAESAKAFIDATQGVFKKIWMIEPDEINQKTISSFITDYEQNYSLMEKGSIQLLGYALGNETGDMPFMHQGGHGGHLLSVPNDNAACKNVAIRKLDDILSDEPSIIKMDIEGSELPTLKGGQNHIVHSKPRLAISAYHRATDLLDITDYIESVRGDYKIGIRHHTEERWDTCLYFY